MNRFQLESAVSLVLAEAGIPSVNPDWWAALVGRLVALAEQYRRQDDGERQQLRPAHSGAGEAETGAFLEVDGAVDGHDDGHDRDGWAAHFLSHLVPGMALLAALTDPRMALVSHGKGFS